MWHKIKSLFSKKEEVDLTPYLVIWGIIEGPMTSSEDDDEESPYYIVVKASIVNGTDLQQDAEVFITEVYSDSFNEAYQFKRHFDRSIEPILISMEKVNL